MALTNTAQHIDISITHKILDIFYNSCSTNMFDKFDGFHRIRNLAIKHSRCFGGGVARFETLYFLLFVRRSLRDVFEFDRFVLHYWNPTSTAFLSLSFACSILAYLRKTLQESSTIFVEHALRVARIQLRA